MEPVCHFCGLTDKLRCTDPLSAALCEQLDTTVPPEPKETTSDGGSSSYYRIPEGATDLQDLIEAKEMSFARANLFKAIYRMGEKQGVDIDYDLNKLEWFLGRMRRMRRNGHRL